MVCAASEGMTRKYEKCLKKTRIQLLYSTLFCDDGGESFYSGFWNLVLFSEYFCTQTFFSRSERFCYSNVDFLVSWDTCWDSSTGEIYDFLVSGTWLWDAYWWIFWHKTYHKNWKSCTSEYTSLHYNSFCSLFPLPFLPCLIIQKNNTSISLEIFSLMVGKSQLLWSQLFEQQMRELLFLVDRCDSIFLKDFHF